MPRRRTSPPISRAKAPAPRKSRPRTGAALRTYREKRDFHQTPEPQGRSGRSTRRLRFVVQQHAARRLHWDFRLEVGGVLKSWAVPRGPSLDPSIRRLAVPTEDHPIEYATFEGVIPAGHYGAGPVIVWDDGTYVPREVKPGHIVVELFGKKLKGAFMLIRTAPAERGRPQWLLMKVSDAHASARRDPVKTQPKSVRSGRTLADVLKESIR